MAVRKHEKGAIFKENQRILNAFRIAGVRRYGAIRTLHKYKSKRYKSNKYKNNRYEVTIQYRSKHLLLRP